MKSVISGHRMLSDECICEDAEVISSLETHIYEVNPKHIYPIHIIAYAAFGLLGRDKAEYYVEKMVADGDTIGKYGDVLLSVTGDVKIKADQRELHPHHFPLQTYLSPFTTLYVCGTQGKPALVRMKWRMFSNSKLAMAHKYHQQPVHDSQTGHLYLNGSIIFEPCLSAYENCSGGIYAI